MTSDENPHDPQGAPGPQGPQEPKEPQEPQEPQSEPDAQSPQDAQGAQSERDAQDAQAEQDAHNDSAEQPPQTWSSPPNGGGEYRDSGRLTRPAGPSSGSKGSQPSEGDLQADGSRQSGPSRLPGSTWLVTLIGSTVYAVALTLILALTTPIVTLGGASGSMGLTVGAPLVGTALAVFMFWAFRRMLVSARFPRPTAAMVLFTAIVLVGFVGSMAVPIALGFGESADGLLTAGVLATPLSALVMLASRGERVAVRWAAAVAAVVMLVAGVLVWNRGEEQVESMAEEQREINLAHEDEAAVLDVEGWEPFRSEINDAMHEEDAQGGGSEGSGETEDGAEGGSEEGAENGGAEDDGSDGGSAVPGTGQTDADEEDWLSVFTVFYQDGDGGYLRSATWADERTAEDPDAVLRAWCDEEGSYCEELDVDGAEGTDSPVIAQWYVDDSEPLAGSEEGSENPEAVEELGAPQSVRYEYEPGRVVYLGPWTDEPDRSQNGGSGGPEGAQDSDGSEGAEESDGTEASPDSGTTLGHADFDAQELAELVTQVRPAEEEDLVELADRTVEYFRSPEDALTGD